MLINSLVCWFCTVPGLEQGKKKKKKNYIYKNLQNVGLLCRQHYPTHAGLPHITTLRTLCTTVCHHNRQRLTLLADLSHCHDQAVTHLSVISRCHTPQRNFSCMTSDSFVRTCYGMRYHKTGSFNSFSYCKLYNVVFLLSLSLCLSLRKVNKKPQDVDFSFFLLFQSHMQGIGTFLKFG